MYTVYGIFEPEKVYNQTCGFKSSYEKITLTKFYHLLKLIQKSGQFSKG